MEISCHTNSNSDLAVCGTILYLSIKLLLVVTVLQGLFQQIHKTTKCLHLPIFWCEKGFPPDRETPKAIISVYDPVVTYLRSC